MAKKKRRRTSFVLAKEVLSKKELREFKDLKKAEKRSKLLREINLLKNGGDEIRGFNKTRRELKLLKKEDLKRRKEEEIRSLRKQNRQNKSKLLRGLRAVGRGNFVDSLSNGVSNVGIRKRGRPKGSFDPRFRAFGGSVNFRRVLRARLRQEQLQSQQQTILTPNQQALLQRQRQFNQQQMLEPESRTIPSTSGRIQLRGIMDEINDAINLVD